MLPADEKPGGRNTAMETGQPWSRFQAPVYSVSVDTAGAEPPSIDFGAFGRALRRFWPVLAASIAVCLGGAWYYLKHTPTLYLALGEIAVGQERSELMNGAKGEDLKSLEVLKSIEREIAGQNILLEIARRFDMHHDPGLAGPRAKEGLHDDEAVIALGRRVTASLERGTRNIVISVEDTEPARAREICQAMIDMVVKRDNGSSPAIKEKAVVALEAQATAARARMEAAQTSVNTFRARYPDLPLEENPSEIKTNSYEDRLKELNIEAAKAREEVAGMTATAERIAAAGKDIEALLAVPGLGTQEVVVAQRKALGDAVSKLEASDYGWKHPAYQAMQKQIQELSGALLQTLLTAARVEIAKFEKATGNLDRVEARLAALKGEQNNFSVVAGEFQPLARELKSAQTAYSAVLGRLNEEKTNSAYGAGALSVVAEPLTPTWPSKPRRLLVMAAGGAAGVFGGLGLVVVFLLLDRSVRSPGSGERLLHMPGLAVIPRVKEAKWLAGGHGTDSPAAECFRGLRAAMARGGRSFLFTSARAGEGKSYVALNFAASLAQQGHRTLLIDANLRAPVLDTLLLGERARHGLADYLTGEAAPEAKFCRQTEVPNLFLFSAGIPRSHPGEILGESAFLNLLNESLQWFHRVVIDTPSAGQYADALPLAKHVDAVCLVLRAGVTKKGEALKALHRLATAGARPAGFVLNAAPEEVVRESFSGGIAVPFQSPALLPALPSTRA